MTHCFIYIVKEITCYVVSVNYHFNLLFFYLFIFINELLAFALSPETVHCVDTTIYKLFTQFIDNPLTPRLETSESITLPPVFENTSVEPDFIDKIFEIECMSDLPLMLYL
jgi:hypothetical protein